MSKSNDSQPTENVSDHEYENFLVQINEMVQEQHEDPDESHLHQHLKMLERNLKKQIEDNRTEVKRLDIEFYKQMKLLEEHQEGKSQQHQQRLQELERRLLNQFDSSARKSLEVIQHEVKNIQSHLSGETHILHKLLDKHAIDLHEENTELKKEIELLSLEQQKTEKRLTAAMRSHHVWVTMTIIASLGLYKMIELLFLQS